MYGKIPNHDMHWIAGDSVNSSITYKVDGYTQNLQGYTVTMVVRLPEGETGSETTDTLIATFSSGTGDFNIPSDTTGKINFTISPGKTRALNPENLLMVPYVYALEVHKEGTEESLEVVKTLLRGKLYIYSEVAR